MYVTQHHRSELLTCCVSREQANHKEETKKHLSFV